MPKEFSVNLRDRQIASLSSKTYDLIVIGGGITGAGIALDAVSRGLRVVLLEKNDFAFGTSSRSTKLIHGGLRYLKQLEFGLVKEVGSERAVVHRLAPHLVLPEKMLLPLYERRGMGYWLTSIGLRLYDFLAGVKPQDQRKMLTKSQTLKYEPLLLANDIKGGAIYAEYRTDDARLTIEIAKKASELGADLISYCTVSDFKYEDGQVVGVSAVDSRNGTKVDVHGRVTVNAAGPWVDQLRERDKSRKGKKLHLTKGVHIVVSRSKFPVRQAIYFDVADGRMIFAIPRGRATYIGTTDTNYEGPLDQVEITNDDAAYLVNAVNSMFPTVNLLLGDIESWWAGLRPLIHEEGKSASELSRKDEIFESPSGLISIAGGKLTGYRKMAERVVDLVLEQHLEDTDWKPCSSDNILLSAFKDSAAVHTYIATVELALKGKGIDTFYAHYLVHNYGQQTDDVLALVMANDNPEEALARAEVQFAVRHEMVLSPADFFVRRTGMILFNIHRAEKVLEAVMAEFAALFKWTPEITDSELVTMRQLINNARRFATSSSS